MSAPARDQQLYVIVWGAYVKIGCSVDPIDRLTRLADPTRSGERPPRQRGNPELVGTVPGGFGAEAWLHAALAGHRIAGEWYHLRGPVMDLVDAAARTGLVDLSPRQTRRARRDPAAVRLRTGQALAACVSRRGAVLEERRQHAVPLEARTVAELGLAPRELTESELRQAVCGAGVKIGLGHFDPTEQRACPECLRVLPR